MSPAVFQRQILAWFDHHGRKDLPWQHAITPYRVWVSETMLQQTQVATAIPYFNAFITRFANIEDLARASIDEILHVWSGLGYYSRARNLHKAAQRVIEMGHFPETLEDLLQLPGVGLSTAGAILSIAFHKSHPILDGNVKRVLSRFKGVDGWPGNAGVSKRLWVISAEYTPQNRVADYTQAIMDLGATVCTRNKPNCPACPLNAHCFAYKAGCVSAFPAARPAKEKPIRYRIFLVLNNNENQILLEKRPPSGVWGGLWSLPEFDTIESALNWCRLNGIRIASQQTMAMKRHTFSHFHLNYTPLVIQTDSPIEYGVMEADQMIWHQAGRGHDFGLAAPVKLLLQQLIKKESTYGENDSLRKIGN